VYVFHPFDVNPDHGRGEHEDAGVLIARAQSYKKSAETQGRNILATDTSHWEWS
jgi:hypothetical protein